MMPVMMQNRLSADEREELLKLAWLNQNEFARLIDMDAHTLSNQLKRGMYKDLYVMIGASRKFNSKKIRKFLNLV